MNQPPPTSRFPGLDSLRAYAALFVVIGHIPMNQASGKLPAPAWGAMFFRGESAVCFFFTLSGFLITYLLLEEQRRHGTIDVSAFYLRRVLRIWPLYFATIGFGLAFYNVVLPRLGIAYPVHYPLWLAVVLYLFFLPNLMNSLYTVGGLLNPTWSIGIEEQFYLGWAPAMKRWHARLPAFAGSVLAVSLLLFALSPRFTHGLGWQAKFLDQLKFHFMAAGALAAWALHRHRDRFLSWPIFRRPLLQWGLGLLLAQFYFWGAFPQSRLGVELYQLLLYPWLVVEVGANTARRMPLENPVAEWLGRISYGIYMLHMIAVYATTWLFQHTAWWAGRPLLYVLAYYGLALGLTVALAAASFRFFEGPLLALKARFTRFG